jgi:hypothetical protein
MRLLLLILSISVLPACSPVMVGHGHIELDENTDPRFSRPDTQGSIGTLNTRGDNVYLNDRTVHGKTYLRNNDKVHTGPASWVRIEFSGASSDKCMQGIQVHQFSTGRLLGDTHICRHHLETENGLIDTFNNKTRYHIHTYPGFTELTVMSGIAFIAASGKPDVGIRVLGGHEVRLEGQKAIGPRRLTQREIDQRTEWTKEWTTTETPAEASTEPPSEFQQFLIDSIFNAVVDHMGKHGHDKDDAPTPEQPSAPESPPISNPDKPTGPTLKYPDSGLNAPRRINPNTYVPPPEPEEVPYVK